MKTIQSKTARGTPILIAVKQVTSRQPSRRAKLGGDESRLDQVGKVVGEICSTLHQRVSQALSDNRPDEVTIQFGLTLTGNAGLPLITEASAEASFQISATWRSSDSE